MWETSEFIHVLLSGLDHLTLHKIPSASHIISSDPSRLRDVLSCPQDSYLSLILPQLGSSSVLDDAFRSLKAIASFLVYKDTSLSSEKVLAAYHKALGSLQSAMYDDVARHSPELLCATCILALFEVSVILLYTICVLVFICLQS